jgi:hypothetical protein
MKNCRVALDGWLNARFDTPLPSMRRCALRYAASRLLRVRLGMRPAGHAVRIPPHRSATDLFKTILKHLLDKVRYIPYYSADSPPGSTKEEQWPTVNHWPRD